MNADHQKKIIEQYLQALSEGDRQRILTLFSPDAMVHSPLYGDLSADDFYRDLLRDTAKSRISLQGIFTDMINPDRAAAHFRYHWKLSSDRETAFDCVDIFHFDGKNDRIKELTIIYDTQKTREAFEEVRRNDKEVGRT